LIAAEALTGARRLAEAEQRLTVAADMLDPKAAPATWGEYLRLRGALHAQNGSATDAYHDFAQSTTLLDLLGERYQAGLSHLALGRLVAETGARSIAERHLGKAMSIFEQLDAERDLTDTREAQALLTHIGTGEYVISPSDADEAIVRRIVDAAALPDLLGRETATALLDAAAADSAVLFVRLAGGDVRVIACAGCDADAAPALARSAAHGNPYGRGMIVLESLGRDPEGPRFALVASPRPVGHPILRRLRMIVAVAQQGFALCAARDRSAAPAGLTIDRSLEPLLPGFLSASAAMTRVVEQIQRLQGNDLTVLITGESGTGKELVARAIHVGSPRSAAMFLPYNCTTTGRDLADSQLFGHRRGSFTGAVSDQPGLVRSAAGGTLFLDEIGDMPMEAQTRLLRVLQQGEYTTVGGRTPIKTDVRIVAASNKDLRILIQQGLFREDLFFRLNVVPLRLPPLRERIEDLPDLIRHFFSLAEKDGLPPKKLDTLAVERLKQHRWPGNVRELENLARRLAALYPQDVITASVIDGELAPPAVTSGGNAPMGVENLGGAVEAYLSSHFSGFPNGVPPPGLYHRILKEIEVPLLTAALAATRGNQIRAADLLGLNRNTLRKKIRDLDIQVYRSGG
jgi:two-component system nitrogen regulation response regulator GlnG